MSHHDNPPKLATIKIRTLNRVMAVTIALLFVLHMVSQYGRRVLGQEQLFGIGRMFHLDGEQNIPTYVNGLLLAFAATLLWLIWGSIRQSDRKQGRYWFWLGVVFWYMSVDDLILLHERLNSFVGKFSAFDGVANKWVLAGIPIAIGVALCFLRFWLRLPSKTRYWFAAGATIYLGGAIGFEIISQAYLETIGHTNKNMLYGTLTGIEEAMEMAGVAVFITSLARYISREMGICGIQLISLPTLSTEPESIHE